MHDDYQDTNVLFDGAGNVVAVIDWDKAETRMPAEEVLRAVHLSFPLDPVRTQAFVDGYRTARPMSDDELERGAEVYGYDRDRSIWVFEEAYLRHNDRVRPLAEAAGRFVPFADRWAETRSRTTPTPRLH